MKIREQYCDFNIIMYYLYLLLKSYSVFKIEDITKIIEDINIYIQKYKEDNENCIKYATNAEQFINKLYTKLIEKYNNIN